MIVPFAGLVPAPGRHRAAWVVEAMAGRHGVALIVPAGYEAHVRIHHRIHTGQRWAEFAPEYLVRGTAPSFTDSKLEFIDGDGNLDPDHVDALVPLLRAATTTPERCHYALWEGWGWVRPGSMAVVASGPGSAAAQAVRQSLDDAMAPVWRFAAACPVEPWWGGRDMILFDGPIDAVASIGYDAGDDGEIERQCPQWWWPDDRAWFVGTEIDDPWTYVAGSRELIDGVLAEPRWEAVAVEPTDHW